MSMTGHGARRDSRTPDGASTALPRGHRNVGRLVFGLMLAVAACMLVQLVATQPAQARDADGNVVVVSLGDSYSSGEGIEPFYGQDKSLNDKVVDQDWLAHRSKNSWSGKLVVTNSDGSKTTLKDTRGDNWTFVASSGAVTSNITSRQQKDYTQFFSDGITMTKYLKTGTEYIDPQQNAFDSCEDGTVDYVTFTLGGNDADFVGVVTEAATGSTYLNTSKLSDKLEATWAKYYESGGIRDDLKYAYEVVADRAGPQAKIIVAGYPTLLEQSGKGFLFSAEEAELINDSVREFNYEIAKLVQECREEGYNIYFVSVQDEFDGHEAYSSDPYINSVMLFANDQDIDASAIVSSYSIHPNNAGSDAYARCVQKLIDDIEEAEAQGGTYKPDAVEMPSVAPGDTNQRQVVLTLDVSGSMSGDPLEETKEAAREFVSTVFDANASVALVSYSSDAQLHNSATTNEISLRSTIRGLRAGGDTNIEAALKLSYQQIGRSTSSSEDDANNNRRIIVLMSDGEANEGLTGDDLIEYAQTIKDDGVLIYTLGFFQSSGGTSEAVRVLKGIASDGCYYEVADASDLRFFFGDMAESVKGTKYMYVKIACPVNVRVVGEGGVLDSGVEELSTRADFGSLSFEDAEGEASDEDTVEAVKVLRLKEGASYDVQIFGTGEGSMDYTIGFVDSKGRYSDMREFADIQIHPTTRISAIAEVGSVSTMQVDADGDGFFEAAYQAGANSVAHLVDNTWMCWVVVAVVLVVVVLLGFLYVRRTFRGKARNQTK